MEAEDPFTKDLYYKTYHLTKSICTGLFAFAYKLLHAG